MDNLVGDDVFKARRVVGQRDSNPPPQPVAPPPGEDMIETEFGLRPRAEWEITLAARRAHQGVKELTRTDYVVTKSMETGRKLSSEWTSWRQHLRDVVNGNGEDVQPEPARWAVDEQEQPEAPLLPAPDALMADYGPVGTDEEAEAALTTDDLLGATDDAVADVVSKLTRQRRKRFTELLNVELAELEQSRGGPKEDRKREARIQRLLGVFARVGEM